MKFMLKFLAGVGALTVVIVIVAAIASGPDGPSAEPAEAPASTDSASTDSALFADIRDGMQQWTVGDDMPAGDYVFRCEFAGSVSVMDASGRTWLRSNATMIAKDIERRVRDDDLYVTVMGCRVYHA